MLLPVGNCQLIIYSCNNCVDYSCDIDYYEIVFETLTCTTGVCMQILSVRITRVSRGIWGSAAVFRNKVLHCLQSKHWVLHKQTMPSACNLQCRSTNQLFWDAPTVDMIFLPQSVAKFKAVALKPFSLCVCYMYTKDSH